LTTDISRTIEDALASRGSHMRLSKSRGTRGSRSHDTWWR